MRKKYKYHYFYKITNNLNNHFYYGVHNTDNLDDGYMGSGRRLHYAYKKYGVENFTKEILKFFDTSKEAFEYEAEIVNEELINDQKCYNIRIGGKGGWNPTNNHSVYEDKDHNRYWLETNDELIKEKELTSVFKNFIMVKDLNGNFYQVKTDDPRYISGELKFIWVGKKHKEETKNKISKTLKSINHNKGEKNPQYGTCWITKDEISIIIKKEELDKYLFDGWIKGRKIGKLNYCWINKDGNSILIKKEELDKYLFDGWIKGRKIGKYNIKNWPKVQGNED